MNTTPTNHDQSPLFPFLFPSSLEISHFDSRVRRWPFREILTPSWHMLHWPRSRDSAVGDLWGTTENVLVALMTSCKMDQNGSGRYEEFADSLLVLGWVLLCSFSTTNVPCSCMPVPLFFEFCWKWGLWQFQRDCFGSAVVPLAEAEATTSNLTSSVKMQLQHTTWHHYAVVTVCANIHFSYILGW